MSENYQLVNQSRRKVEIYRDTGVSKNAYKVMQLKFLDMNFFDGAQ